MSNVTSTRMEKLHLAIMDELRGGMKRWSHLKNTFAQTHDTPARELHLKLKELLNWNLITLEEVEGCRCFYALRKPEP